MGWTYQNRPKGMTNEEFFKENVLSKDTTILASGTVNNTFYAAVQSSGKSGNPGEVWGLVAMTNWAPKDYFNFGYKVMDETEGPYQHAAPLNVLKALTPTDRKYAKGWRMRCAIHQAQRRMLRNFGLKDDDQIVLNTALSFTDGASKDTFTIRRRGKRVYLIGSDGYQAYHVPHWRDRIVSVIRDGQSHPTPRSAGYDNEWARNLVGLNEDEAAEAMAA